MTQGIVFQSSIEHKNYSFRQILYLLQLSRTIQCCKLLARFAASMFMRIPKHGKCYSIVSCSPLILIGAQFSSLAINQLQYLSLFKKMMKKQQCSEITAFKNSDPENAPTNLFFFSSFHFGTFYPSTSPLSSISFPLILLLIHQYIPLIGGRR